MLGRQARGTVGGYRQVRMLMVVTGVEGFTWANEEMDQVFGKYVLGIASV